MRGRGLALLPLGLSLLAVVEIVVFIAVVHAIGGAWAVLLGVAASLTGMALLRREGIKGWRRFQAAAAEGRPPGHQVSNSLVGLLGALLLALPGFVSSAAGLLLLLPPGRQLARHQMERYAERRVGGAVAGDLFGARHVRTQSGDPIVVIDEDPAPPGPRTPAAAIEGEVIEGEVLR
ncbi:FxsA family protein [Actinoplanes solisilvae]|uniref:FxsA family protein n=1 Tax=Actinoplanes solisilvae TaxID=2486853 RepID=UPI000FD72DAE|nr:FxsA family protein [Actinoplanes solisilvae]